VENVGISAEGVSSVCRGKRKSAGGFFWRYPRILDLQGEKWKPVVSTQFGLDFHSYCISTCGRVKNISHSRLLKQNLDTNGYCQVSLTNNSGKVRLSVHKLVSMIFLPSTYSEKRQIVDHIDNQRENNHVQNLRWVTQAENLNHYYKSQKYLKT